MPRDDDARLLDMLAAAVEAQTFVAGMSREDFFSDRKTQVAVIHSLLVLGEASIHVSDERKSQLPTIPWDEIRGMRHRLAHESSRSILESSGMRLRNMWHL
ncbi:MAG: DUF86 domain-containing protein [Phycisphaerales bacterium]|nr:MAG: DUF86 domain-containing protein [Phycisphaerales bacterium]